MSRLTIGAPITKSATRFHNEPGGGLVIEQAQDVEDILDDAKANARMRSRRYGKQIFHHHGYIPNVIYWSWTKEQRDDPEWIRRWLNENSAFKTHPGRL